MGSPDDNRFLKREALAAFTACLVLTMLFTWPWRPNPNTAPTLFTDEYDFLSHGDAVASMYALQWGAHHPGDFYGGNILLPLSQPLATTDPRLTEGIWSIPLFWVFEPALAWGFYIWLAFTVTAFASYVAGRWLGRSRWCGLAMAVLAGYSAFRGTHICHGELAFLPFLPLSLVALAEYASTPTRRLGVLCGLFWALAAIEQVYLALLLFSVYPAALLFSLCRRRLTWRQALLPLLVAVPITAVILLPALSALWRLHTALRIERQAYEIHFLSAHLLTWFSGYGTTYPLLFPGCLATGLGLFGLRRLRQRSPELVFIGLLSFLLSFGTMRYLFWQLGLPAFEWPTPYEWLFAHVLPFRAVRGVFRHALLALLILSFAGALVIRDLARRGPRWRVALLFLLGLAFLESRAGMREITVRPARAADPAYAWLARQPGDFAVLDLPKGQFSVPDLVEDDIDGLWLAWLHGKPTPNGMMAIDLPWLESINKHLARPRPGETPRLLQALGVGYVTAWQTGTAEDLQRAGLTPVFRSDAGVTVLRVDSPAAPARSPAEVQERLFDMAHPRIRAHSSSLRGSIQAPAEMTAAAMEFLRFHVIVKNDGTETWCANGAIFAAGPSGDVIVGTRRIVGIGDGAEPEPRGLHGEPQFLIGILPCDIAPGETGSVLMTGLAPRRPGLYRVDLDLTALNVCWFHPEDSSPTTMLLRVRR